MRSKNDSVSVMTKKLMNSVKTKYTSVGNKAMKELFTESIIDWYHFNRNNGFVADGYNLANCVRVKPTVIKQSNYNLTFTYTGVLDLDKYPIEDTHLYQAMHREDPPPYKINDPAIFIFKHLQWNQGIIGLPTWTDSKGMTHYAVKAHKSLKMYTADKFKWGWKKKISKFEKEYK